MESQQTRLIEALRKLHRHVKQPIEEEDMQIILQTARSCGFDFEGVQDIQYNAPERNTPRAGHDNIEHSGSRATIGFNDNKDANGNNRNSATSLATGHDCLGKRKRAEFGQLLNMAITPGSDVAVVANVGNSSPDTNGGSNLAHESETSPLKRQKAAAPTVVDDYWGLDNYFDQVTTPYNPSKPPTILGTADSNPTSDANLLNVSNALRQPWEMPASSWNDLFQSLTTNDDDPTFEINGTTSAYPIGESTEALSDIGAQHDWGSTMWWDPSLLFDTRLENSELDGDDLPTSSLNLSHEVNEGSF